MFSTLPSLGMRFRWPAGDSRRTSASLSPGFTLIEILAAVALLVLILGMTTSIINSSSKVWRQANAKIESFQAARGAFDVMTAKLSRATLNTYWDYYDAGNSPFRIAANPASFVPTRYGRYSDLHFICGPASSLVKGLPPDLSKTVTQAVFFVAPTGASSNVKYNGLSGLLAACGYFVAFGNDESTKPDFLETPPRYRWRLMEVSAPVEELKVYSSTAGSSWVDVSVAQGRLRSVAENVIALVVWPRLAPQDDPDGTRISDNYTYDSRTSEPWSGSPPRQPVQAHQLPPNLQVMIVAIDEESAKRLESGATAPAAITNALQGLFTNDVSQYATDLKKLEDRLALSGIGYRTFPLTVALKEAKWSP